MKTPSIIDFTGMKFRSERPVSQRIRGRAKVSAASRSRVAKTHLTRNVRGALDQLLGW